MIPRIIITPSPHVADRLLPTPLTPTHPDVCIVNDHKMNVYREAIIFTRSRPIRHSLKYLLFTETQSAPILVQNTLLKTLEESPPWLQIILMSDSVHQLLPTLRSRCLITHMNAPEMELEKVTELSEYSYAAIIAFSAKFSRDKDSAINLCHQLALALRLKLLTLPNAKTAHDLHQILCTLEALDNNVSPTLAIENLYFQIYQDELH